MVLALVFGGVIIAIIAIAAGFSTMLWNVARPMRDKRTREKIGKEKEYRNESLRLATLLSARIHTFFLLNQLNLKKNPSTK